MVENSERRDDPRRKGFTMLAVLTTDYIWRGVSQTHRKPALQPEIDFDWYWGDDTMLNAGIWASNIRYPGYPSAKLEMESWVNLTRNLGKGVSLMVETLRYDYPNATSLSYPEVSATAGWRNDGLPLAPELTLQYAWTWDTYGTGSGSFYTDLTLKLALAHGWGLVSHYGHSRFSDQAVDRNYDDWMLGLSHAVPGGELALEYFYSNASQYGRDAAGHFVLTWMHPF